MAGATHPTKSHYPKGEDSYVQVRLGGYVANGASATIIDTYLVEFDCHIKGAVLSYTQDEGGAGQADVDSIDIATLDDTKTIVAQATPAANVVGVAQTLHSDIVGYQVDRGDKIQLTVDTQTANAKGYVFYTLYLKPLR